MSNEWKASTKAIGTQFAAVVRRIDRAEAYFLMRGGKPILHHCAKEAEIAACQHIIHLLNTEPRFLPAQRGAGGPSLEEQTFGTVTNRKGHKSRVNRRRSRKRTDGASQASAAR